MSKARELIFLALNDDVFNKELKEIKYNYDNSRNDLYDKLLLFFRKVGYYYSSQGFVNKDAIKACKLTLRADIQYRNNTISHLSV